MQGLSSSATRSDVSEAGRRDLWLRDGRLLLERRLKGMGHGAPVATAGPGRAGTAGPYLLDVGISSSLELLKFWGLIAQDAVVQETSSARQTLTAVVTPKVDVHLDGSLHQGKRLQFRAAGDPLASKR